MNGIEPLSVASTSWKCLSPWLPDAQKQRLDPPEADPEPIRRVLGSL